MYSGCNYSYFGELMPSFDGCNAANMLFLWLLRIYNYDGNNLFLPVKQSVTLGETKCFRVGDHEETPVIWSSRIWNKVYIFTKPYKKYE